MSVSKDKHEEQRCTRRKRKVAHPVHELFNHHEELKESWCTVPDCTAKLPGSHAGNKMSHLQKYHPDIHKNVASRWADMHGGREPKGGRQLRSESGRLLNGVRMSGPQLELACIRLITEHGFSFKCLSYSAVQDLTAPYINAMPARERPTISAATTPTRIRGVADRVRQKMMEEMENRMVSLKADGCSRGHRHFLGLNVQFVKDGQVVVRTLAVEELHIAATAINLKNVIGQILRKFDISLKNVVSFTSDNGGNYILAGKLLNQDEEVNEDLEDVDTAVSDDWLDIDLEVSGVTVLSVRCAAHTLQLAIDDAFKKNRQLKPLTDKVRDLAKFLRTPTNVKQLRAGGKALPPLDVVTRWGSTFDLLVGVLKIRHFFESVMHVSSKDRTKHALSDDEWNVVEGLVDDLSPVRKATVKMQASDLTLGHLYAIWMEATMALEKRGTELSTSLLKSMEERAKAVMYSRPSQGERLSSLLNYPAFNAAVFVDPRFFSLLTPDQVEEAKLYLLQLWQTIQARRGVASLPPEPDSDSDVDGDLQADDGEDSFSAFLLQKNKERMMARSRRGRASQGRSSNRTMLQGRAKVKETMEEYDRTVDPLPAQANVMQFWQEKQLVWPELYEVAIVVLAIPATQVSVERLFSSLRFILRPQRYGLGPEHVDDIVFLHANSSFLREVGEDMILQLRREGENVTEEDENDFPRTSSSSADNSSCSNFFFPISS